ncbi:MAG TPA: acyl carrier protein [Pirellulaceae bacterium]|nr:acyl carrier protein [Pirellulaceae bacterium]
MIRQRIMDLIREQLREAGVSVPEELTPSARFTSIGLDSLAFAVIIARLEEETGLDPFGADGAMTLPRTIGELIRLYDRSEPNAPPA